MGKKASRNVKRLWLQNYLLISVQLIGFFVFTLYPMLWTAKKSWYYYDGLPSATRFVGWANFITAIGDNVYWTTWLTTLKFAVLKLPIELPLAMLIAVLLNSKRVKGKSLFRAIYFMPSIISVAIVGLIFTNMFDYFGFINAWMIKLGLASKQIDWYSSTGKAMSALVTGAVWNTFGVNVLYFMAAMSNISEDLYEAAYLDGANKSTVFFKITLPLMAPVLQTILLLSLNGTLHTCDYILTTTNGAPHGSTHMVMSYIAGTFLPGFAASTVNIGYGCAMSLITSVIMCLIAAGYSKLSSKLQNLY